MENHKVNSYHSDTKNTIQHEGVITKITNQKVTVSLNGNINCEGCNAKTICGSTESNQKEIEVLTSNPSFQLNDPVDVIISKDLGMKAVFWAYVLPFILVISVLMFSSFLVKEWIAGLLSIFVLIPYYLLLFAFKKEFVKSFKFSILKTS